MWNCFSERRLFRGSQGTILEAQGIWKWVLREMLEELYQVKCMISLLLKRSIFQCRFGFSEFCEPRLELNFGSRRLS